MGTRTAFSPLNKVQVATKMVSIEVLLDLLLLGGRLGGRGSRGGLAVLVARLFALSVLAGLLGVDPSGVGVLEPDGVYNVDSVDNSGQKETSDGLLTNGHGQEVQGGSQVHRVYRAKR